MWEARMVLALRTASRRCRVWGILFLLLRFTPFVVICILFVGICTIFAVWGLFCATSRCIPLVACKTWTENHGAGWQWRSPRKHAGVRDYLVSRDRRARWKSRILLHRPVNPQPPLLDGIFGSRAIVACFLCGVVALVPPRVAGMVRDEVRKVNKPPLAAPISVVEADKLKPGECKKVNLDVNTVEVGNAFKGNKLVHNCWVRLVGNLGFLGHPPQLLVDRAALDLGPAQTADELDVVFDRNPFPGLRPSYSLLAEGPKIVAGVARRLWPWSHIDLPISRGGPPKAGGDHVQESTVDAFSLKRPIPLASWNPVNHISGRRSVNVMELNGRPVRLRESQATGERESLILTTLTASGSVWPRRWAFNTQPSTPQPR